MLENLRVGEDRFLKFIAIVAGAFFIVAGLAACAGTTPDRFAAAKANTRANKPLTEWVDVQPEHLTDVDPSRLKGEGAALIVARSYRENSGGERSGSPHMVMLRDVSTSTIWSSDVQRTGTEADVGWVVMLVPPGQYALNRGQVRKTTRIRNGEATASYVDIKGHPYVPLNATIRLNAGDVAYVGTIVFQSSSSGGAPYKTIIRDERSAADKWAKTHIPNFAQQLQTKILQPPVPLIN
jgi:hypothetical protein